MKKLIFVILLLLGFVLAETPKSGWAYVISAIGVKNSPNNVVYTSGDTSTGPNANYVLSPQVIVWDNTLDYVGSLTPFTGCLNSKHYTNGAPDGMCITGIVNDLTTGGTDKALSAEQGKVLNDKVTNLQSITRTNYLRPALQTQTIYGVTCTNNGDGTYTFNGTATEQVGLTLLGTVQNKYKGMKIIGCPNGGNGDTYSILIGYFNSPTEWSSEVYEIGNGTIIRDDYDYIYFGILIRSGTVCNNLVFKPMITNDLDATYDDFIPYQDSLATNQSIIDATRTNLLSRTIPTQSKNGITITNNDDGTYTINGTATAMTSFIFQENLNVVPNATYKLVGSPRGKSIILAALAPDSDYALDFGDGGFLTTDQSYIKVYVQVNEGVVCDNVVVKPMLTTDLGATYDDFISFDNSIVTGINSGIKMDLLWENSIEYSEFVPQTVLNGIDLSEYDEIEVQSSFINKLDDNSTIQRFKNYTSNNYLNNFFLNPEADTSSVISFLNGCSRKFDITQEGITFQEGNMVYNGNVYSNWSNRCVPRKIYGIKLK